MSDIRDYSQGYHATTTWKHVEAPMCDAVAGDLLVAFVSIDDSAGTSAQTVVGGMPVPYVFYNDDTGGTPAWTDYTEQANDSTAGDWFMSPTVPTVNDCIYFGSPTQFNSVKVMNSVAGVASVNTVWALEYYNGTVWGTLTTTTDTFGANMEFVTTVAAEAIWTPPANWATVAVNSVTAYWVRWRCTTSNTFGTRPVSTQAWITPVLNGNNGWRPLYSFYAGTTPSPISAVWKISDGTERDTTFFYTTAETADVELISIKDVQAFADSGVAALTVNVVAAAGTFIRTTGSWVTDGFTAGMQIMPSGFTNAGNNYARQISTITTTTNPNDTITVTSITGLVNESGNANERIISWPFNSNVSGGGAGNGFDGWAGQTITTITATTVTTNIITCGATTGMTVGQAVIFTGTAFGNLVSGTTYYVNNVVNATTFKVSATYLGGEFALATATGTMSAAFFRLILPTLTTTKDDCLLLFSTAPDAVSVPSIIEGACQLIAAKDGSAHSDGHAWGYQKTAGTTPAVYMTQMAAVVAQVTTVAVNPPTTGPTVKPTYTVSDASVYVSPFTGAAWNGDSVPVNTITTPFTGRINGQLVANGGTTYTRADTGVNSYHAQSQFTGLTTNGTWAGTRTTILSRNLANKNLLFHIQPYLPIDTQTLDSVSLSGACGAGIGLASAAGRYKAWHVAGAGAYGVTQRHQPAIIHPAATEGVLSFAGTFTVSGGAGTFVAGNRLYVGASWAAATKRAYITSVSGTTPTQTINYSTIGDWSKLDFAASDAVVEWTAAGANGATGTAGAISALVDTAVVEVGLMLSSKIVASNWLACSVWALDTCVIAGGTATAPMTLPKIVAAYADGHERRCAIQQNAAQGLFYGPVQIGDGGTNPVYADLSTTSIGFPGQYNKDLKEVSYNSIDNVCGKTFYLGASCVVDLRNTVFSSRSKFHWKWHASTSTSATIYTNGCQVIGAGTIQLRAGLTYSGITFNKSDIVPANGATITNCIFSKTIGLGAVDAATTGEMALITASSFVDNGSNYSIRLTNATAGTYSFSGITFSGGAANKDVYISATTGTVTINVSDGGTTPTYTSAGATVVINNTRTLSITGLAAGSRVAVISNNGTSTNYDDDTEIAGTTSSGTSFTYDYNWTGTPVVANIVIIHDTKGVIRYDNQSLGANGLSLVLQPQVDRQYENAA